MRVQTLAAMLGMLCSAGPAFAKGAAPAPTRTAVAKSPMVKLQRTKSAGFKREETIGRWNVGPGGSINVPYAGSATFSVPTNIANYNFGTGSTPQNLSISGGSVSSISRVDNGGTTTYTINTAAIGTPR